MDRKYYIVVTEWLYPTESGRDVVIDFDTKDEAIVRAFELCDDECDNFVDATGCDYLPPEEYAPTPGDAGGVIVTPKTGGDEWYFAARVIEVPTME